jgi:hypothetical protein
MGHLLEKPIVTQLVKKFPPFTELEGSLPCSQEPTTRLHHETDEFSPFAIARSLP